MDALPCQSGPKLFRDRSGTVPDPFLIRSWTVSNPSGFIEWVLNHSRTVPERFQNGRQLAETTEGTHVKCFPWSSILILKTKKAPVHQWFARGINSGCKSFFHRIRRGNQLVRKPKFSCKEPGVNWAVGVSEKQKCYHRMPKVERFRTVFKEKDEQVWQKFTSIGGQ